ncbi:MFS transporter [Amycolatopsis sp. NPDC051903]|uniref:MFS transporter n=1 Tax=Amycolatopsis sp. NPDC051903 TaxID=3363936 RepID=UPI0037B603BC
MRTMRTGRTLVYLLLLGAVTVNYVDRVILSVAAKPVSQELGLSAPELGLLLSAFLWSYLVFVLPWGILTDRIGTKPSTVSGLALWTVATLLTGLSGGFGSIFAFRLIMGVGEASTYPAGAAAIREWIPTRERGLATTVFNAGGYAGPAIGSVVVGFLVGQFGWRSGFYFGAIIGALVLLAWIFVYKRPEQARFIGEAERAKILTERGDIGGAGVSAGGNSLGTLLRSRTMWGMFVAQGCAVYTVYMFLTWLPSYLQATHGLTVLKSGLYTAVPYAVAVPGTMLIGYLSDRLLRGQPAGSGRRRVIVTVTMLVSSCILLTPFVSSAPLILVLFSLSLTSIGSAVGLNIALLNDLLADPADTGRANGILMVGGNGFGVLAPIITGFVISWSGGYGMAFVVAGALLVVGAVLTMTMTRSPIAARGAVTTELVPS